MAYYCARCKRWHRSGDVYKRHKVFSRKPPSGSRKKQTKRKYTRKKSTRKKQKLSLSYNKDNKLRYNTERRETPVLGTQELGIQNQKKPEAYVIERREKNGGKWKIVDYNPKLSMTKNMIYHGSNIYWSKNEADKTLRTFKRKGEVYGIKSDFRVSKYDPTR